MPALSIELVRAICDAAHAHQLPVAVHHYWCDDLEAVTPLPIQSLEHLTMDRAIPAAVLEHMAEAGIDVTTDLEVMALLSSAQALLDRIAHDPPPLHERALAGWRHMLTELAAGRSPSRRPHPLGSLAGTMGS